MKKFLSLILVTVFLCGVMMPVACAESAPQPRDSAFFGSYGTHLSDEGGGRFKIVFTANGLKISNTIGVSSYEVERQDDDGNWEDCSGLLNGQTGSGVISYSFSKYFNGVSKETYRVKVTFICVRNDGSETKTYTSPSITVK